MKILSIKIYMALFATILSITLFALMPVIANAQSLIVDFEEDPLFSEANFLPGNEVVRTVDVTNGTDISQDVLAESINGFDSDGLGDELNLVIKEGVTTLYNDTLGNFLISGPVPLSSLGAGLTTTYSFGVTFNTDASNDTQEGNLGFDLCIGFSGGEMNCGDTVVGGGGSTPPGPPPPGPPGPPPPPGGGGGGGGGGGIVILTQLEVFNEQVLGASAESSSALIEWDSNLLSTSQVIYGKASDGPFSLNLTVLPYFGYPLGTVEDPLKVIHHSVLLTGLEIGETYLYRVVSRASPATVGFQYSFILTEDGVVATGPGGVPGGGPGGQGGDSSGVLPPDGGGGTGAVGRSGDGSGGSGTSGDSANSGDDGSTTTPTTNSQVAAAGLLNFPDSFLGWLECFGLFLLFIVIIYILWILWSKNNDNYPVKSSSNYRNIFFFVGSLISILIAYFLGWSCTIIPLIIVTIISLGLYIWNYFRE